MKKDIKEIALMVGTQGDGYTDNVITFEGNKVLRASDNFMQHKYDSGEIKLSKEDFLNEFNKIGIEDWNDSYIIFKNIDGYSWELNVFYTDGEKLIKKGSNDYPENFDELINLLEIDFVIDSLDQNQED